MNRNEGEASVGPIAGADLEMDLTGGIPAIAPLFDASQVYAMRRDFYLRIVKPFLDRVGGLVGLIVVSPVIAVVAMAILITMGFPVILRQKRVGLFGKVFTLYKFRTMAPDRRGSAAGFVGDNRRLTHKSANDPRITPLGRLLRRTRLDELPQFINVLRGDLSLVGPRPEMVSIVAQYEPWQHRRHAVKPGITGLWQISDTGDKLLFECTEMELEYLEYVSLSADLSIMLRTLPVMARRGGI